MVGKLSFIITIVFRYPSLRFPFRMMNTDYHQLVVWRVISSHARTSQLAIDCSLCVFKCSFLAGKQEM